MRRLRLSCGATGERQSGIWVRDGRTPILATIAAIAMTVFPFIETRTAESGSRIATIEARPAEDSADPRVLQIELTERLNERRGELRSMKLASPPLAYEDRESGLIRPTPNAPLNKAQAELIERENEDRLQLFRLRVDLRLFDSKTSAAKHYAEMMLADDASFRPSVLFRCVGSSTFAELLGPSITRDYLLSRGYHNVAVSEVTQGSNLVVLVTGRHERNGKTDAIEILGIDAPTVPNPTANDLRIFSDRIVQANQLLTSLPANTVPIALDGIAPVVHPMNPLAEITVGDLKRVIRGEIASWDHFGGDKAPIQLHLRNEGSGAHAALKAHAESNEVPKNRSEHPTNRQLANSVFTSRDSLGFLPMALANSGETKPLRVVSGNKSKRATPLTVKDGDYPLVRLIYLQKPSSEDDAIQEFLNFLRSANGAISIVNAGFTPFPH